MNVSPGPPDLRLLFFYLKPDRMAIKQCKQVHQICLINAQNRVSIRIVAKNGMTEELDSRNEPGQFHLCALHREKPA